MNAVGPDMRAILRETLDDRTYAMDGIFTTKDFLVILRVLVPLW